MLAIAAAVRVWLFLAPLLLAGCTQPPPGPSPQATGPLPPSLLVDRTANGTLQVYVHAKQGNVRYDFVNLTEYNDFEPSLTWHSRERTHAEVYAVDLVLERPHANLSVEVLEGEVRYAWRATFDLNLTARVAMLDVQAYDASAEAWDERRTFGLPYEKLLPREERP